MNSLYISYFLEKVYLIETYLGGSAKKSTKNGDDFTGYKDIICEKLNQLKANGEQKIVSMQKERAVDGIRLDAEINNLMTNIEAVLTKMNEVLRKQSKDRRKYTQENIDGKVKVYNQLRSQFLTIQQYIDQNSGINIQSAETLADMKIKLMGDNKGQKSVYKETSKEDKEAMDRWKQGDQIIDDKLAIIIEGTGQWVFIADHIGQVLNHYNKSKSTKPLFRLMNQR